ncbi:MAG: hypothetical protein ACRCU3_06975 [Eubacteriaceae bacterium]
MKTNVVLFIACQRDVITVVNKKWEPLRDSFVGLTEGHTKKDLY